MQASDSSSPDLHDNMFCPTPARLNEINLSILKWKNMSMRTHTKNTPTVREHLYC